MFKNQILALSLAMTVPGAVTIAQTVVPGNLRAAMALHDLANTNGMTPQDFIYGLPPSPGTILGDYYLDAHWQRASIVLYTTEKPIDNYKARYDIRQNELEVMTATEVKVVPGDRIKSFAVYDSASSKARFYVNAKDLGAAKENRLVGFPEVLAEGQLTLLKMTEISVKRADYNSALNVGSRDDKILKNPAYYVFRNNSVEPLRLNRKKFMPVFGDRAGTVGEMIDQHGLSLSREADLVKIFEYHNQLAAR